MRFVVLHKDMARTLKSGARLVHRYSAFSLLEVDDDLKDHTDFSYCISVNQAIRVNGRKIEIPEGQFVLGDGPRALMRFAGPIDGEWRNQLRQSGVQIEFWCPPYGACAQLPQGIDTTSLMQTFPFIVGIQPYIQEQCSRGLPETAAGMPDKIVDVVCFSRDDVKRVGDILRERGIEVLSSSSHKIRACYHGDTAWLRDIHGVKIVDHARSVMVAGTPLTDALGISQEQPLATSFYGRGQVVAIADTGLDRGVDDDSLHPDFKGRIRAITSWPINESWTPYTHHPGHDDGPADASSGHGTHVAGIAVGSGARSQGKHRGIAPEAHIVFQAIEQFTEVLPNRISDVASGYYLNGRPLDLRDLFREAREFGARIHVNAWGDPLEGAYSDDCYETDDFLFHNQDAVILFAAGNHGADADGDREIDRRSLYAPASAKNAIAIGATEGPLSGVGIRGTWEVFDPQKKLFVNRRDRADAISGQPDRIALFSSAGPTVDGRIKPDLCAPGTNLVAPRSQLIAGNGWGFASPMPYYMYLGGTSVATGVAGGFIAILREAWQRELGGKAPSGPALKALAVLGAAPVLKRDSQIPEPRWVAGFGRLNFMGSVRRKSADEITLVDEVDPGLLTGEIRAVSFTVTDPGAFTAVLTWYDAPGEAIINNLNLCLVLPGGDRIWGNHQPGELGEPDQKNNLEVISLSDLPAGEYRAEIIAHNIPVSPQPFALAMRCPRGATEPEVSETGTKTDAIDDSSTGNIAEIVPVTAIVGLGKKSAARLAQRGIDTLQALLRAEDAILKQALGSSYILIDARLTLLRYFSSKQWPDGVNPELCLQELTSATPPEAIAEDVWRRERPLLLPLLLVFNQNRWRSIRLRHLRNQ